MPEILLLCAACIAAQPDPQSKAWKSQWATTLYRGNALCMEHFEEIRKQEQKKKATT